MTDKILDYKHLEGIVSGRKSVLWKGLCVSAFLLLMSSSIAPQVFAGDIVHYCRLALKNDPQLRSVEYASRATGETLRQAYSGLLPRVYGDLSLSRTLQDVKSSDNQVYASGNTHYNTKIYSLTAVQPLFRYSSIKSIEQAKTLVGQSAIELEKARQDTLLRVAEAYMSVLLNSDKLAAINAEESAVEQLYVRSRERVRMGMAPVTDHYDTEARYLAVQAQRAAQEDLLTDALQSLAEICGEPALDVKALKTEIPLMRPIPETIGRWTESALIHNLDIRLQRAKVSAAEKEVELQKAGHYPNLDLQLDFTNNDAQGSLFGGGSNTMNYVAMVKLNMPIYEGGRIDSKTREAALRHQGALQGLAYYTRAAERKVRYTYNGILSAITKARAMNKSIEAQKLVVEAKEEGLKAGLYISLAVLDAVQDLYRYKKDYSQAVNDYIIHSLRLKHAVGALTPEAMDAVNGWLKN